MLRDIMKLMLPWCTIVRLSAAGTVKEEKMVRLFDISIFSGGGARGRRCRSAICLNNTVTLLSCASKASNCPCRQAPRFHYLKFL